MDAHDDEEHPQTTTSSGQGRNADPAGDTVDLHATGGLSDDDEVDLDYNDASEGENNNDDDERSSRADEPSVSERSIGKRRRSGSPKGREEERTTRAKADEQTPSTSEPIASVVLPKAAPPPPPPPIDREKRCPFLLRVFVRIDGLFRPDDFSNAARQPEDEVQMYTWADATLAELSTLVMEVEGRARRDGAEIIFATVFIPEHRAGMPSLRQLGKIVVNRKGPDDALTLRETPFRIGEQLAVSVFMPRSRR